MQAIHFFRWFFQHSHSSKCHIHNLKGLKFKILLFMRYENVDRTTGLLVLLETVIYCSHNFKKNSPMLNQKCKKSLYMRILVFRWKSKVMKDCPVQWGDIVSSNFHNVDWNKHLFFIDIWIVLEYYKSEYYFQF